MKWLHEYLVRSAICPEVDEAMTVRLVENSQAFRKISDADGEFELDGEVSVRLNESPIFADLDPGESLVKPITFVETWFDDDLAFAIDVSDLVAGPASALPNGDGEER